MARHTLQFFSALLVALAIVPTANFITTGAGLPWWNDAVEQWTLFGLVVPAVALLAAALIPRGIDRLIHAGERVVVESPARMFLPLMAILATLLSVWAGWSLFHLEPVTLDEFSHRWQAALIASGHLTSPADAHPEFYSTIETLERNGRWSAQFPMGGPALLSLALRVRLPWLLNPLLAGVSVVAFHHFAVRATDMRTARYGTVLLATCPFLYMMAGSQMNHVPALALLWIALAALASWTRSQNRRAHFAAALIGAAIGMAATIRPFDAVVVAVAAGVFQLRVAHARPELRRTLLTQIVAGAIPVALVLVANHVTVGNALTFAYDALNGPEHRPGFHLTPLGFAHTPRRAVYMASAYLMKLDVGLFGWPVPSLLLVALALLLQLRATAWDVLLVAIAAGFIVGYACYWSESYFLGPRFLFILVPILALYTARFPLTVRERLRSPTLRRGVALLIPLWVLIAWTVPAKDARLYGVRGLFAIYRTQAAGPLLAAAVRRTGVQNAVVFVPEGFHARLAARLRALGFRPLAAERIAAGVDACTLHAALDSAERIEGATAAQRRDYVSSAARGVRGAVAYPRLPPSEQIALVPTQLPSPECADELRTMSGFGLNVAEMLPRMNVDSAGRFSGNVTYVRDFGARNELLRSRYGDRAWYVARPTYGPDGLRVNVVPY